MLQPLTGIDIIEIARLRDSISRWGERFLHRIYTDAELAAYRDKPESLAVRFAAKEAAMKALYSPEQSISWQEIEILSGPGGEPQIHFYGEALKRLKDLGLSGMSVTLSHSRDNAIALVIGIREV